jgi:hypothetical protein
VCAIVPPIQLCRGEQKGSLSVQLNLRNLKPLIKLALHFPPVLGGHNINNVTPLARSLPIGLGYALVERLAEETADEFIFELSFASGVPIYDQGCVVGHFSHKVTLPESNCSGSRLRIAVVNRSRPTTGDARNEQHILRKSEPREKGRI